MKKLFAILLTLALTFSLAACGGKDDGKTPSSDNTPPISGQQEQNTPAPGASQPDKGATNESPLEKANAYLKNEMNFSGFSFPDNFTVATASTSEVMKIREVNVVYCPVDEAGREEILQALFYDTGMSVMSNKEEAASSPDEIVFTDDDAEYELHFDLIGDDGEEYSVLFHYYRQAGSVVNTEYEAQSLRIKISIDMKK